MLLSRFLERLVRKGSLTLTYPDGRIRQFGGLEDGPTAALRIIDPSIEWTIPLNPALRGPEAYMNGRFDFEQGTIYDLLELVAVNQAAGTAQLQPLPVRMAEHALRRVRMLNRLTRSRRNVAHHYDLSDTLYDLFLDRDRQYSCAYFPEPDISLEAAQEAKKRHLAAKLLLKSGQKVLDIGSGWGGLGLTLARESGVDVTGLTLSTEQHTVSNRRARQEGLDTRVRFKLQDYRNETARYDRIISVGMFEHVGVPNYDTYFNKVAELLADDGVAVLHSIGRAGVPGTTNPWIRKYIFPGGYCPSLSEVLPAIERAGLIVTDIEILRLHYAETLRHWRQRFYAHRDEIKALYDERFCRMWDIYLCGSEVAFRHQGQIVFQIQMAKKIDTVPLTRDYITDYDRSRKIAGDRAA